MKTKENKEPEILSCASIAWEPITNSALLNVYFNPTDKFEDQESFSPDEMLVIQRFFHVLKRFPVETDTYGRCRNQLIEFMLGEEDNFES